MEDLAARFQHLCACQCDRPCARITPSVADTAQTWEQMWKVCHRNRGFERLLFVLPVDSASMVDSAPPRTPTVRHTEAAAASYMEALDSDLIGMILRFAGVSAVGMAAAVSRSLRTCTMNEELWHGLLRDTVSWLQAIPYDHFDTLFYPSFCAQLVHGEAPERGWRHLCRMLYDYQQLLEWQAQCDAIEKSCQSMYRYPSEGGRTMQLSALHIPVCAENRRLSKLQLNDYREAQRISPPPAELVTAALLMRTLIGRSDGSSSGTATEEDQGEEAMEWFRQALQVSLGNKFGEHAQAHVGEFLKLFYSFDAAALPPACLLSVEAQLRSLCLARLDERLRLTMMRHSSGLSDECRALRVASAITRWVVAVVKELVVRSRLQDTAMVGQELSGLAHDLAREVAATDASSAQEDDGMAAGLCPF